MIGMCVVMGEIADQDGQSAITWGGLCALLCIGAIFVPFPFLRVLAAGALTFAAMIALKLIRNR